MNTHRYTYTHTHFELVNQNQTIFMLVLLIHFGTVICVIFVISQITHLSNFDDFLSDNNI